MNYYLFYVNYNFYFLKYMLSLPNFVNFQLHTKLVLVAFTEYWQTLYLITA